MGQGPAAPRPNSHPRLYRACSQAHSPAPRPPEAQQSPPGSQHKAPFPQQRSAAPGPVLTGRGLPPPTGPGPPHGPHRARLPAGLSFPQGRTGPVSPPGPASRLPQHKARPSPVPPARPSSAPRPPQARPAHPELASLRLPRLRLRLRRLFPSLPDRSRSLSRSLRSRLRDPDPISRPPGAAPALRPRCARLGAGGRRGRGRAYTPAGCFRLFFFFPFFFFPNPPPLPILFLSFILFLFSLFLAPKAARGGQEGADTALCVQHIENALSQSRGHIAPTYRSPEGKKEKEKRKKKTKEKKTKQKQNGFPQRGEQQQQQQQRATPNNKRGNEINKKKNKTKNTPTASSPPKEEL